MGNDTLFDNDIVAYIGNQGAKQPVTQNNLKKYRNVLIICLKISIFAVDIKKEDMGSIIITQGMFKNKFIQFGSSQAVFMKNGADIAPEQHYKM